MKKKKIIIAIIILIVLFGIFIFFSDDVVENEGTDTYTLMIYMCASDLESDGGYATTDISEMLDATIDEKVNVILQTGGTLEWQDYEISSTSNQIYKIENGELNLIKDELEIKSMTEADTLLNFVEFCKTEYPADRYSLILWDHGGGAISGYGYDENNIDEDDTLTLDELKYALEQSNVHFEFVGFDACLMANVETAYALKDVSDYLIASEETEPGTGWEYVSLLNKLSSNTSENTVELSKVIVDEFIKSNNSLFWYSDATLSTIDLRKMNDVFSNLYDFMQEIKINNIEGNDFAYISKSIEESKSYAEGECDTIDLVDFAKKINNSKTNDLINSLNEAVVYNKVTDLVEDSSGLSIYFPYNNIEDYEKMLEIYPKIGIDDSYIDTLTTFVNLLVGGKNNEYTIHSHTYATNEDYTQYDWYNNAIIDSYSDYYEESQYEELEVIDKGEYYALELSDEDWENIVSIGCEVFYDDEEGFIDLGSDNYYEFDEAGDLKIIFDGTWISIEGQTVPFYVIEEDDEYTKGAIPAYLNDSLVNLIVVWYNQESSGKVIGAQPVNGYGDTTIVAKGLKDIKAGDRIEFLFDYYTYDGEYEDSYIIGDTLVVSDNNGLIVTYDEVGSGDFYVYYKITDIYGNEYYVEGINF